MMGPDTGQPHVRAERHSTTKTCPGSAPSPQHSTGTAVLAGGQTSIFGKEEIFTSTNSTPVKISSLGSPNASFQVDSPPSPPPVQPQLYATPHYCCYCCCYPVLLPSAYPHYHPWWCVPIGYFLPVCYYPPWYCFSVTCNCQTCASQQISPNESVQQDVGTSSDETGFPLVHCSNEVPSPLLPPADKTSSCCVQPANDGVSMLIQPSNKADSPLTQPSNELLSSPLILPLHEPVSPCLPVSRNTPFTQPSNEAKARFAQQSKETSSNFTQPSNEASSPFAQLSNESASPFAHPPNEVNSPFTQPSNETKAPFAHPLNEVSSPFTQSSDEAGSPFTQPSNEASSPFIQLSNEANSHFTHQSNEVSSTFAQPSNEASSPFAHQSNEVSSPFTQPSNEVSSPFIQLSNEASSHFTHQSNEVSSPFAQPSNEASSPLTKSLNKASSPFTQLSNEATLPIVQPLNEFGLSIDAKHSPDVHSEVSSGGCGPTSVDVHASNTLYCLKCDSHEKDGCGVTMKKQSVQKDRISFHSLNGSSYRDILSFFRFPLLLRVCVTMIALLLLLAGDVERNPGPTVVTVDKVAELAALLDPAAANWYLVFTQLGVSSGTLNQIRLDSVGQPTPAKYCMTRGLQYWVTSDENATYEKIIAVFNGRYLTNKPLAEAVTEFAWTVKGTVYGSIIADAPDSGASSYSGDTTGTNPQLASVSNTRVPWQPPSVTPSQDHWPPGAYTDGLNLSALAPSDRRVYPPAASVDSSLPTPPSKPSYMQPHQHSGGRYSSQQVPVHSWNTPCHPIKEPEPQQPPASSVTSYSYKQPPQRALASYTYQETPLPSVVSHREQLPVQHSVDRYMYRQPTSASSLDTGYSYQPPPISSRYQQIPPPRIMPGYSSEGPPLNVGSSGYRRSLTDSLYNPEPPFNPAIAPGHVPGHYQAPIAQSSHLPHLSPGPSVPGYSAHSSPMQHLQPYQPLPLPPSVPSRSLYQRIPPQQSMPGYSSEGPPLNLGSTGYHQPLPPAPRVSSRGPPTSMEYFQTALATPISDPEAHLVPVVPPSCVTDSPVQAPRRSSHFPSQYTAPSFPTHSVHSSPVQHLQPSYQQHSHFIHEIDHSYLIDEYADQMRGYYRTTIPQCFSLTWPPPPTRKVFNLSMISHDKYNYGSGNDELVKLLQIGNVDDLMARKSGVDLEMLFHLDLAERQVILIEGAPGAGKSTLAWHICQKWKAEELFQEFRLVVFVQLRDTAIQSASSLVDILPVLDSESHMKQVVTQIQQSRGNGVLFVLDGWDEFPAGLYGNKFFNELISSPSAVSMPSSTLLITSRPIASGNLHRYASSRVETIGFNQTQLKLYFEEALADDSDKVQRLETCLRNRPIVKASCYLPLNASIVVHLFLALGANLPSTLHGVFLQLIIHCIVRHIMKQQVIDSEPPHISSLDDLPADMQTELSHICAMAYHGVMNNKVTFSEYDLKSFNLPPDISTLSLIQVVVSFMPYRSRSYNFLHLSVQELLTAYHISKLPPHKQVEIFKKLFGQPRFAAVFQYYAAFTKLQTAGIQDIVVDIIQKHKYDFLLTLLHCLYEAQDSSLCQFVASKLNEKLDLSHRILSPVDCIAVGYFLCQCATTCPMTVDLSGRHLESYKLELLAKELMRTTEMAVSGNEDVASTISELDLSSNLSDCTLRNTEENDQKLSHVLKPNKTLNALRLHYCGINGDEMLFYSEYIGSYSAINKLDLSQNSIQNGEDGLSHLCEALTATTSISELNLSDCKLTITEASGQALSRMLMTTKTLSKLELGVNPIQGGLTHLHEALTTNTTLVELRLPHCKLHAGCGAILCGVLETNKTLKLLDLFSNDSMSDQDVTQIIEGLKRNHSLKYLDLSICGIHDAGMKSLTDCLIVNDSLLELHLYGNDISPEAAHGFGEMLKHNSTLRKLNVSSCGMTTKAMKSLFKALELNSTLEELSISFNNSLTDAVLVAMVESLKRNTTIKTLVAGSFTDTCSWEPSVHCLKLTHTLELVKIGLLRPKQ